MSEEPTQLEMIDFLCSRVAELEYAYERGSVNTECMGLFHITLNLNKHLLKIAQGV